MTKLKPFAIIVVLCFSAISVSADKTLAKQLYNEKNLKEYTTIHFDHESVKNGSLSYLLCHQFTISVDPSNITCSVYRENHYIYKPPTISSCNVTLHAKYPFTSVSSKVRVIPINRAKTLILWAETKKVLTTDVKANHVLKFTIVDFENCKITETDVNVVFNDRDNFNHGDYLVWSTSLAFYDNSFDVSFHHEVSGVYPFCRVRIDMNTGKIIHEREYWYIQGRGGTDIIPKDSHNPDKGLIFFDADLGLIYKWENYSLSPLLGYPESRKWFYSRYSMQHENITMCKEIESTRVKCDQINYNGTITMHTEFDLGHRNIAPVPYTLQGGGFILLTTECISNCTEGAVYQVSKVDVNGQRQKLFKIEGFNCSVMKFTQWHSFFEDDLGTTCVSLLCYKTERKGSPETVNIPEELQIECLNHANF